MLASMRINDTKAGSLPDGGWPEADQGGVTMGVTGGTGARIAAAVAVTGILASGLAGCGQSVNEASGEYCSNLSTLRSELGSLTSLVGGDATLEDLQAQRDAVGAAYDDMVSSAGDLDAAVEAESETAYQEYRGAVEAIPGDTPLTEAAPQYASAVQAYLTALASIADEAGCADS